MCGHILTGRKRIWNDWYPRQIFSLSICFVPKDHSLNTCEDSKNRSVRMSRKLGPNIYCTVSCGNIYAFICKTV